MEASTSAGKVSWAIIPPLPPCFWLSCSLATRLPAQLVSANATATPAAASAALRLVMFCSLLCAVGPSFSLLPSFQTTAISRFCKEQFAHFISYSETTDLTLRFPTETDCALMGEGGAGTRHRVASLARRQRGLRQG